MNSKTRDKRFTKIKFSQRVKKSIDKSIKIDYNDNK